LEETAAKISTPCVTFAEFAAQLLTSDTLQKIEQAKREARLVQLPIVASLMDSNTIPRIIHVMEQLLGVIVKKKRKADVIKEALRTLRTHIPTSSLEELNRTVGDFGVVRTNEGKEDLILGEIVFLVVNGQTPTFGQCVRELEFLQGYIIREEKAVRIDLPQKCLAWARLAEKRRDTLV
jgi:hypothetical protein